MSDTKTVQNRIYVYPNTDTETEWKTGQATVPEGYEVYLNVTAYFISLENLQNQEDASHIHQYDYYLQCVRVPEWASDAPTPPQPTYKAIIVNDSYGLDYVLQYTSGAELNPSAVEVGKSVVFSTNNPSYTQTFPAGLDVEEYGTLPSGAVGYKFTMPDYDVEITITEVQPQPTDYDITLVNEDSITVELWDENWNRLSWTNITPGTNLRLLVKNNGYEAVSSDVDLGTPVWESSYNQWQYQFTMPSSDITITIQERQTKFNFTLVNEDSVNIDLYDSSWNTLDISQPIAEGTIIQMMVGDYDYEATFSPSLELTQKYWDRGNSRWYYQFLMPSNDLTVSIVEMPTATLTVVNQDSRRINWYDGANWYSDTHTAHVGDNIDFVCWETSDKITFGSPIEYTEEFDSEGRYQYHFVLNGDLTVTTGGRTEAGIYYDGNTDINILVGDTPTYPTLENPNSVTPITYTSSNTDLATVDSSGNVTLVPNATGEAYITATFEGDSTYDFTGAHFKLRVRDGYNVHFIKTGAVEVENVRTYNLTKGIDTTYSEPTAPNDTIFVIGAAQDDKVMWKDSSNTWTTLTSTYTSETIEGQSENGIEFTIPSSGVTDNDYFLVMANTDDLYDISKNFQEGLYNDGGVAWWYDKEDQSNPGTYVTKYPNGTNLGIETRDGQTYTINPTQTQEQGGSVGTYIVMPNEDIEITKTN